MRSMGIRFSSAADLSAINTVDTLDKIINIIIQAKVVLHAVICVYRRLGTSRVRYLTIFVSQYRVTEFQFDFQVPRLSPAAERSESDGFSLNIYRAKIMKKISVSWVFNFPVKSE